MVKRTNRILKSLNALPTGFFIVVFSFFFSRAAAQEVADSAGLNISNPASFVD
jgi:hypothetical protein